MGVTVSLSLAELIATVTYLETSVNGRTECGTHFFLWLRPSQLIRSSMFTKLPFQDCLRVSKLCNSHSPNMCSK